MGSCALINMPDTTMNAATKTLFLGITASRRAQRSQQRRLEVGGHLHPRRVAHEARRLAVRPDECLASRASSDMHLDGGAHIRRQRPFHVLHQQLDARHADDVFHGLPPASSLRYPRTIRRARWTRCRTVAESTPNTC